MSYLGNQKVAQLEQEKKALERLLPYLNQMISLIDTKQVGMDVTLLRQGLALAVGDALLANSMHHPYQSVALAAFVNYLRASEETDPRLVQSALDLSRQQFENIRVKVLARIPKIDPEIEHWSQI